VDNVIGAIQIDETPIAPAQSSRTGRDARAESG
jgi:hypothetical protein